MLYACILVNSTFSKRSLSSLQKNRKQIQITVKSNLTFVGSKLTRPHARAATPPQWFEMATIPIESGPGWPENRIIKMNLGLKF